jgi:diguanylate cyclase (GGDEF)-like protein
MVKNYISSLLLGLSILLFLLMLVLMYLTFSTNKVLRNDAYIINTTGIVRGSIQRLTKMELAGCTQVCEDIVETIDFHISDILNMSRMDAFQNKDNQFIKQINSLNESWINLKQLYEKHREFPDNQIKNEIISMSEYCWAIADAAVLNAQITTEGKLKTVKMFYPISLLIVLCNVISIFIIFTTVRKKLEYHAANDSLTGVYNRYSFEQVLENEIQRSTRYDRSFSLMFFDIDHFKNINDSHGHHVGDTVLVELSELVRSLVRKIDTVSRIGGEEFSIIVPEISKYDALKMAEKIRSNIENHNFSVGEKVTVSFGVTEYDKNARKEDLLKQADQAMYKAKQAGRNRVELFT